MFSTVFLYELRYWTRRPAAYLYFAVLLTLAFVSFAGSAGFFDPAPAEGTSKRVLNSPFEINFIVLYSNKLLLLLIPAVVGASIHRDYQFSVHSILYSYPVRKEAYLLGKFLSSLLIIIFIATAMGLGLILASQLPNLHPGRVGAFSVSGYLQAYLLYTIPNLFVFATFIFTAVALSRSAYTGYATALLILLGQLIIGKIFEGNNYLLALFDPFGQDTVSYITQYWTLTEQNARPVPLATVGFLNRTIWLSLAGIVFAVAHAKFGLTEYPAVTFTRSRRKKKPTTSGPETVEVRHQAVSFRFAPTHWVMTCLVLSAIHFRQIVRSSLFVLIVLATTMAVVLSLARVTNTREVVLLPVTGIVLSIPAFFFTGAIILLTFVYGGMLVHRERATGMNHLIDTSPTPDWVFWLAKLLALLTMQCLLLLTLMTVGVLLQLYNGYYQIEVGLYFFYLFVLTFPTLAIWAFVALFVHTMLPNMYLGIFVLLLGWMGVSSLPAIGISTRLLLFNPTFFERHSAFNGYGDLVAPYLLVKLYWFVLGLLLLAGTSLLWNRGVAQTISERLAKAKTRLAQRSAQVVIVCLVSVGSVLGFVIFREEQKIQATSNGVRTRAFKAFEEKYCRYARSTQPKITRVRINLNIYPEVRRFESTGSYVLVNQSPTTINTLLIKNGFDEITKIDLDRPYEIVSEDTYIRFSVLKLSTGLLPGDSLTLRFAVKSKPNTLFEKNSDVLRNGTFLKQDIFPRIGYFLDPPLDPMDGLARETNYQTADADRVDFAATLSTSADQIAVAPGKLQKEWRKNGRRFFAYKTPRKIKYSVGFLSGRYIISRFKENGVELEVYHHPTHSYNLGSLTKGIKASLTYNTTYFGPYPYESIRLVEFPRSEGTYATAYTNCIPVSEVRFIANPKKDTTKTNLAFYTPAHELTHQWWGGQVMPAAAHGATMIVESITEYVTLKIYERQFGRQKALAFLKLQRERYLEGRTNEGEKEPPLVRVEPHQQYLAYGKGEIAFNAVSHYLGEEKLNGMLADFLNTYRHKGPPYPTSIDLVERLKKDTPNSLQYLLKDNFETVTFYDHKIDKATVTSNPDGTFRVKTNFTVRKSSDGVDQLLSDYVEVGFFSEEGKLLALDVHKVMHTSNVITVLVKKQPIKVVIDPNLLTLDKDLANNSFDLR